MTTPCSSCNYHFSKSSPRTGKPIPNYHGKCTRPTGLCSEVAEEAPRTPAVQTASVDVVLEEMTAAASEASLVDQAVMDAEDVFRDLGRIETAAFYATVSDSLLAQTYQKIKKNKSYKNIPYVDTDGKTKHISSLEDFCNIKLGKSVRRLQQLSQNLNMLGSDLYESAEQIGFRAKDYRALKALPPEEQEVVKTALASESKDEVIDILQDMAARHQAEKEAAKKEKDDLTADLEARGKLLKDKATKLETTEEELYRLKSLPPDANLELKLAREEEAVDRLHQEHVTFLGASKGFLESVAAILAAADVSAHTKEHAVWEVRQVCEHFNRFLLDHGIPVDFSELVYPDWMRDTARADLEAGNVEEPNGAHSAWN